MEGGENDNNIVVEGVGEVRKYFFDGLKIW